MAIDRTGAGDPARTLALLWRQPGPRPASRGPRPGLSVDQVVTAAIALADAEGLAAVTMRRVAQVVGTAPMTLYTYVPGKAELLDLMLDLVYAQMPRPDLAGWPWRERVAAIAGENRALYENHPWMVTVATSRPPLGPGQLAKYEHELGAFAELGLDDVEIDAALTFVLSFVQSCARLAAAIAAASHDSAMSDAQWWAANAPLLAELVDPATFPTATRVGTSAGAAHGGAYSASYSYDFGLDRVLDGLGALIDSRSGSREEGAATTI